MASATSLPMTPIDRKAMAQMPAMGPGPKMATNSSPHTTVLTEREVTRINRPMNQVTTLGLVLRADKNAIGKAMITVAAVPRVAIWMVSSSGAARVSRNSRSGGHIR